MNANRDYFLTANKTFAGGSIPPKSRRVDTGITKIVSRTWLPVFSVYQAVSQALQM